MHRTTADDGTQQREGRWPSICSLVVNWTEWWVAAAAAVKEEQQQHGTPTMMMMNKKKLQCERAHVISMDKLVC